MASGSAAGSAAGTAASSCVDGGVFPPKSTHLLLQECKAMIAKHAVSVGPAAKRRRTLPYRFYSAAEKQAARDEGRDWASLIMDLMEVNTNSRGGSVRFQWMRGKILCQPAIPMAAWGGRILDITPHMKTPSVHRVALHALVEYQERLSALQRHCCRPALQSALTGLWEFLKRGECPKGSSDDVTVGAGHAQEGEEEEKDAGASVTETELDITETELDITEAKLDSDDERDDVMVVGDDSICHLREELLANVSLSIIAQRNPWLVFLAAGIPDAGRLRLPALHSSYRQAASRIHPATNPDMPHAQRAFEVLTDAYRALAVEAAIFSD
jgi:hypothetical protein